MTALEFLFLGVLLFGLGYRSLFYFTEIFVIAFERRAACTGSM